MKKIFGVLLSGSIAAVCFAASSFEIKSVISSQFNDPANGVTLSGDVNGSSVSNNSVILTAEGANFSGVTISGIQELTGGGLNQPKMIRVVQVIIPASKLRSRKTDYGIDFTENIPCSLKITESPAGVALPPTPPTTVAGVANVSFRSFDPVTKAPAMGISITENQGSRSRILLLKVQSAGSPTASPAK